MSKYIILLLLFFSCKAFSCEDCCIDCEEKMATIKEYILYELDTFFDDKWSEQSYKEGKFEVLLKIYNMFQD